MSRRHRGVPNVHRLAASRAGVLDVTLTLPVADMAQAVDFYEAAGFDVRLYEGGGFAFASYEDQSVFDLDLIEHLDPTANAAGCYIIVPDVEAWHARLSSLGLQTTDGWCGRLPLLRRVRAMGRAAR
jgi:catechol 2,3-dioxygenase-like lactoylglutathione lyase family enzyme